MKRIRAEIAAKTAVPAAGSPAQEAAGGEGPRQPIASESIRRTFSVRELLRGKRNEDFIRSAYVKILGREPDVVGRGHYLKHLNHGRLERVVVLRRLVNSAEARERGIRIRGLRWRVAWAKAARKPPLRSIVNFSKGVRYLSRLPRIARDVRNFEALATMTAQQVAAEARVEQQALAGPMKASIEKLRRQIEPLAGAQSDLAGRIDAVAAIAVSGKDRLDQVEAVAVDSRDRLDQVEAVAATISNSKDRLDQTEAAAAELRETVSSLAAQLSEHRNVDPELHRLQAEMVELRGRLHSHWRSITDQKLRLELLLTEARKRLPAPFDATQTETIANEASHLLDAFYVSFEDRYRGTRDDIKNRQKIYVPYARKAAEATGGELIDIGCGRGEWLELLGENGLAASGIDLNRVMVEECHARGLKATLGDALEVLRSLPERSLGAVTGFHIIEHLPFDVLVTLFDEVLRVLKPGGMVIFETPNPANLQVAAERFYMDPTHLNPLPSDLISFIATARGFSGVEVLDLHPMDWAHRDYDDPMLALLQHKLFGAQDYSIIGWKAS
ncbi:methyltransferase domain-containing protein [Mycobacterium sp. KBS0706]|uniref:methyltransferase domain-containing protein n=1 Tax=Mycobacterium sp. KBS0706 TaxID=2578109 RepID=UPI00163DA168|nr:methyltransferase domain-containing protein [Mycobacterium sp. KBS0706]